MDFQISVNLISDSVIAYKLRLTRKFPLKSLIQTFAALNLILLSRFGCGHQDSGHAETRFLPHQVKMQKIDPSFVDVF